MHRAVVTTTRAVAAVTCLTFIIPVSQVSAQAVEPIFQRAQQLVAAGPGQDSVGRAIVDSVLATRTEGTPEYAEALFWRARLARTAAAAERDYRRLSVEYPLSSRAPESLLLLAQLEMARGDRAGARVHLARLQREHPTGAVSTRASITLARLAFDDGDLVAGCAAVSAAREGLAPGDVELRNQLDYYRPRCVNVTATATDTTAGAAPDSAARGQAPTERAIEPRPAAGRQYTVQVAAYETRASAEALARRLSARGYAARVVGDSRPYRVRIGWYSTRERAAEALRQMTASNVRGVVVEAEPR